MSEKDRKIRGLRKSNEESNRIAKESIETALLQILKEKDMEEISIEEIVRRAGVSRMAYYRNYASKSDILRKIVEQIFVRLSAAMHPFLLHEDWSGARVALFRELYRYKDVCRVMINSRMAGTMLDYFNRFSMSYAYNDSEIEKYRMIFWAGATFNLTLQWVKEGMVTPPDVVTEYCNAAVQKRTDGLPF